MKVYIEDWNDSLVIKIGYADENDMEYRRFSIDKEDGFSKLEEVFSAIGIDCEYEECY